jgi:hypothetical protein
MKPTFQLQNLLQQGENAIAAASVLLGQGMVTLDCTGVETLTPEQLTQIFSGIPQTWDFAEIGEVIDSATLTPTFANQISQWIDRRLGRETTIESQASASAIDNSSDRTSPASLDIFNLRDEVIGDYRRYIESFLKIRDPQVAEFVDRELQRGELWPDPLVQLNPSYKKGATVTQLVQRGVLHRDCSRYFSKNGEPFQLQNCTNFGR